VFLGNGKLLKHLIVVLEKAQELIKGLTVGSVGSKTRMLARGAGFDGYEGKAYAVFAIAHDLGHNNDRTVVPIGVATCPLQGHHDQCAKEPSLSGCKIEPAMADVLDGVSDWTATIPKIGDDRRRLTPVHSPGITQK
jgi:hypothetical protein